MLYMYVCQCFVFWCVWKVSELQMIFFTSVTHIYIYRKFLKVTCCDQISILLVTIFFCFHDIQYILLEYITVSHFYFLIPLRYNKNIVGNVMWPLRYIVLKKYLCFIFAVLEKIYYRIKFVGFMLLALQSLLLNYWGETIRKMVFCNKKSEEEWNQYSGIRIYVLTPSYVPFGGE